MLQECKSLFITYFDSVQKRKKNSIQYCIQSKPSCVILKMNCDWDQLIPNEGCQINTDGQKYDVKHISCQVTSSIQITCDVP